MFHRQVAQWADYPCEYKWRYICERDHSKLYNDIFYMSLSLKLFCLKIYECAFYLY